MLNWGFTALQTPDVNEIARMTSRKFSGNWNGSARTMSENSVANARNSRGSMVCSSTKLIPPKRSKTFVRARSSSTVSALGISTPIWRMPSTMPAPSRDAAAITVVRSAAPRLVGTSPIMPKSIKVIRQLGPPVAAAPEPSVSPAGNGWMNTLPGCGSAWKNPWMNTWSNITDANSSATSAGSIPAARRPARSVILMSVTSSWVSTRRVDRSQAMRGTRTRGLSAKFAAKRSEFAASFR